MSISSRITSMEEHVTNAYNGLQGLGADLTGIDKNIDNIASVLDDIYDDLPKVTGSGTTVTLDDTRKGRLESTLSGNTSQYTTTGKNLFNIEGRYETGTGISYTKNSDGSYTLNGTANGNNFLRGVYYLNEQHTLSYTSNVSNSNVILRTRTGTPSAQTGIQDQLAVSSTSGNLTSSKQFDFVEISIVSGTTLNDFKIYIQLEKGSSVTSFEPYTGGQASPNPDYPQEVHVVKGDNKIEICGKNLFNANEVQIGKAWNGTNNSARAVIIMPVEQNVPYTISMNGNNTMEGIYVSYSAKTLEENYINGVGLSQITTFPRTYTSSTKYIILQFNKSSVSLSDIENLKLQVEKGSTATTYEPYIGNTYPINLGVENLLQNNLTSGTINGITYVVNEDKSVTLSGTATSITWLILNNNLPLEAGTYTMSQGYTGNDVRMYSTGLGTYTVDGVKTITKTTSVSGDVSINIPNGTVINTPITIKPMIEKSSKANSYTPYGTTPIELAEISTYNDEIFRTNGKNLFDKSTITTSAYLKEDGTLQTGTGAEYVTSDFIPVTPNTTYYKTLTLSPRTKFYDKNKQVLDNSTYQDVSIGGNAGSFTTPNNAYYFRFTGNVNASTGIDINLTMVNEGNSAIDYEPYGTGEWYWKKRIEKANLKDKSISLQSINSYNIANFLVQPIETNVPDTSLYNYSLCNRFSVQTTSIANTQTEGFLRTLNGEIHSLGVYIRIKSERANTVETFKTWLENNTTYYSWVLFKPIYTKITSSNYPTLYSQLEAIYNAQGYDNKTNISQTNNDLPFKITASALKKWSE